MSTMKDEPCPDCPPGEQTDEHLDGCPRIDTVGQIGPPWIPGPWAKWCTEKALGFGICMRPEGHTDLCPGKWKGPT